MAKISMKARKEIIDKHAGKYYKACKKEKIEILNYFVQQPDSVVTAQREFYEA